MTYRSSQVPKTLLVVLSHRLHCSHLRVERNRVVADRQKSREILLSASQVSL